MKTCPKCGKEVGEQMGVRFCPFCGAGIEVTPKGTIYLGGEAPGFTEVAPPDAKQLPERFGRYRVLREIGVQSRQQD